MLIRGKKKKLECLDQYQEVDFIAKNTTMDKDHYDIIIKGSIYQQDVIILNIYAPNYRASKFMQQR